MNKPLIPHCLLPAWIRKNHDINLTALGKLLFVVLLGLFVLVGTQLFRFESERHQQREIEQVKQQLDFLATALKSRIYGNIFAVSGIKSLVAMNPELTQEDFSRAMAIQFQEHQDLRNIGLARDMVLRLMYPIPGNEGALGLDYRTLPDQFDAVQQAVELNRIVLAGPLALVQDGEGLIARIPIHVTDAASGQESLWGLASVVLNPDAIYAATGITEQDSLRLAIRGRDGRGAEGEVFFGDPGVFDHQPVTQVIELPHGYWQMGATPTAGWSRYQVFADPRMWSYFALAAVILGFSAIIVFLLDENRKALRGLKKERDLFAEGPVFSIEWGVENQGQWPIKSVSSNIELILGYSQTEMLDPKFCYPALIHPDDLDLVVSRLRRCIAQGIDRYEDSYRLKTRTGQYLWFYDFTLLVRDKAGRLTDIRSYLYDQSAQKQAEESLRIAEERLEKTAYDLTENIPVGTYTMVQPADGGMASFAFMSSRFLDLLGLTLEEVDANPQSPFMRLHPDDMDDFMALNARALKDKTTFFAETRIFAANDEVRWIIAESKPRALPDNTTVWEGVVTDVTDRKRSEEALKESLIRFNDLVAYVSVGVYVFWHRANGEMEFEYVSDGWCAMNQIQREDLLKNQWLAWNIIHPDDMSHFKQLNQQAICERKPFVWEGRVIVGGEVRFVLIESNPLFFDNGDSRWFGIHQDISERKQAETVLHATYTALEEEIAERIKVEEQLKIKSDILEKLSMQDGLTLIANRRHFDDRINLEWRHAQRTGRPLSLVIVDIDHFKQYNDHYGHSAGDDCLRQVAQTLAMCCERPKDLVARFGGEEFVALLPETDITGAIQLAEKMRAAVEGLAIQHLYSSAAKVISISVGVACHAPGRLKSDLRQLQVCADQALYSAKEQGRNQVYEEA